MPWVKLDDHFPEHPKIDAAGPLGLALQVRALCHSSRNLTDGYLSLAAVKRLTADFPPDGNGPLSTWPDLMVKVGMWKEMKNGSGYMIHDYLKYNPSKKMVDLQRESDRKRKGFRQDSGRNPPAPDPDPDPQDQKQDQDLCANRGRSHRISGYSEWFSRLWSVAPKAMRKGKGKAFEVWVKKNLETRGEVIVAAMKDQDASDQWIGSDGKRFYPLLATWLNQGRYDDAS